MTPGKTGIAALILGLLAGAALAGTPATSPRPQPRPGATASAETARVVDLAIAAAVSPSVPGLSRSPYPIPRPVAAAVALAVARAPLVVPANPARVVLASTGAAVRLSPRPEPRPDGLVREKVIRTATVRIAPTPLVKGKYGPVCGDRSILGETLPPIPAKLAGCGASKPVRVASVDGVTLNPPATINCDTAKSLKKWVDNSVQPTVGRLGGGVATLKVAASYACRTRNNVKGAKVSEHGRGNAIDISAIILKNGVALTVLKGWRDPSQATLLKAMHREACGPFGTVLGPNADRYHQDHFHLDVARHRGGPYCR